MTGIFVSSWQSRLQSKWAATMNLANHMTMVSHFLVSLPMSLRHLSPSSVWALQKVPSQMWQRAALSRSCCCLVVRGTISFLKCLSKAS